MRRNIINLESEWCHCAFDEVNWEDHFLLQRQQTAFHFVESKHVIEYFNRSEAGLLYVPQDPNAVSVHSFFLQLFIQKLEAQEHGVQRSPNLMRNVSHEHLLHVRSDFSTKSYVCQLLKNSFIIRPYFRFMRFLSYYPT